MKISASLIKIEQVWNCSSNNIVQRVIRAFIAFIYRQQFVRSLAKTGHFGEHAFTGIFNDGTNKPKRPRSRLQENNRRIPGPRGKARTPLRTIPAIGPLPGG
jgi:hypothetical protein